MDPATQTKINAKLRAMQSNEKKIKIAKKRIAIIEEKIEKYINENGKLRGKINKLIGESSLQMSLL